MLECMMIGVFLYCGNSPVPTAMFTVPNQYPTEYIAQQMLQSRQVRAAQPTLPECTAHLPMFDEICIARGGKNCYIRCRQP